MLPIPLVTDSNLGIVTQTFNIYITNRGRKICYIKSPLILSSQRIIFQSNNQAVILYLYFRLTGISR